MSISTLEDELRSLDSEKEEQLCKFRAAMNSFPNHGKAKQHMLIAVQLCCKIQRIRISLRNLYEDDIKIVSSKILYQQSEKKRREGRKKSTNRQKKKKKHRDTDSIFTNKYSSERISDQSFYFRSRNDRCRLENEDMIDIQASSCVFLSSLHVSKAWTMNDRGHLLAAVRQHKMNANLRKLVGLYRELEDMKSSDEQKFSSIIQETSFLANNLGTDNILRAVNAEEIDWNSISEEYFYGRYRPEELKAVWSLAANPVIRTKKWSTAEEILLRCLARDNNFQDWERVNKLMPTSRNGFLCFSRYCYLFKRKNVTVGRRNRRDISAIRKFSSSNQSAHDSSAELTRENVRHFDDAITIKKKRMFSKREKFLVYNYLRRGCSFRKVASMLQNRTEKQVRDHYRMSIQRKNVKSWNKREDSRLLSAVKYLGSRWRMISGYMDNRTSDQCRVRFRFLLNHQKKNVDTYLRRKFEKTKTLHRKIQNFLAQRTRKFPRNKEVEKYFVQQLDKTVQWNRELDFLADDVLRMLKFLNYDLSSIPKDKDFNDWLANYPPTDIESRLKFKEFFSEEFAKLRGKQKTWPKKDANNNNIFSRVFFKPTKVLPPNKSGIYGLRKLKENFEVYYSEHKNVNFNTLWKQQNATYSKQRDFNDSKMLWYKALKAIFFWPLKLETYRPEDLS